MSQENVEIVRKAYEGVTATLELPADLFDTDLVLDVTSAPDFGVVRGLDSAQARFRAYWDMFDAYRVEIGEVLHADDTHVVNVALDRARTKGSNSEVSNRYFHVWTVDQGRITRLSIHSDHVEALKAVGLI